MSDLAGSDEPCSPLPVSKLSMAAPSACEALHPKFWIKKLANPQCNPRVGTAGYFSKKVLRIRLWYVFRKVACCPHPRGIWVVSQSVGRESWRDCCADYPCT